MKFGYTILYVEDVLKTVEFYQKAFSMSVKFVHESNQYAELTTGETTLAFASEALAQSHGTSFRLNRRGEGAPGFEIAFVTKDVHEAFTHAVQNGALPISSPVQKPWGQVVSYVEDNNGILVEICSPI
jgi:lactoylglutathione lyase